jgi:DNA-directed RNA polymerase specialized sigma24 family protein
MILTSAHATDTMRFVNALPKKLRAVFILCELEAMSIGEVVEILGFPSEEVKDRLQMARLAVRDAAALSIHAGHGALGAGTD